STRRCVFSADPKFLLEPLHRLGPFQCPYRADRLSDGLSIPHSLDEVKQLTSNRCDTASSSKKDHVVKGCHISSHPTIGSIDERPIGFIRTLLYSGIQNPFCETAERPKD